MAPAPPRGDDAQAYTSDVAPLDSLATTSTPELPPELWMEILELACFVPRNLEPNFMPTGLSNSIYAEQEREFLAVLKTRRSVVLVCKTWHAIATPILYERILLPNVARLRCAKRVFSTQNNFRSFCGRTKPLGSFPRRLDIWVKDASILRADQLLDLVGSVLRGVTNLQLLTFSRGEYKEVHKMPPEIFAACPKSLRHIVWHEPILPPDATDFIEFLRTHPNIQAISNGTTVLGVPNVDLSAITTHYYYLSLPPIFYQFQDVSLTGLQHLVYDISNTPTFGPFGSVHRFEEHLLNVVGLQLLSVSFVTASRIDVGHLILYHTGLISKFCPNVTRFDIAFRTWSSFHLPILPPKTQTLGIRIIKPDVIPEEIAAVISQLRGLQHSTTLRRVQFTDPKDVRELRKWLAADEKNRHMFRVVCGREKSFVDHDGYTILPH